MRNSQNLTLRFYCGETLTPITRLVLPSGANFTVYNSTNDTTYGPYTTITQADNANIFFPKRTYLVTFSALPTELTLDHVAVGDLPHVDSSSYGNITAFITYKLKIQNSVCHVPIIYNINNTGDYSYLFKNTFFNEYLPKLRFDLPSSASGTITLNGAFFGIDTNCWKVLNKKLFYGGSSSVTNYVNPGISYRGYSLVEIVNIGVARITINKLFSHCVNMVRNITFRKLNDAFGSKITSAQECFAFCTRLKSIEGNLINNIGDITGFFYKCTSLDCGEITVSGSTNNMIISEAFRGCTSLRVPPNITATAVSEAKLTLADCTSLNKPVKLPNAKDISGYLMNSSVKEANFVSGKAGRVTNMSYLFKNCKQLKKYFTNGVYPTNVTNISHMFDRCEFGDYAKPYNVLNNFPKSKITLAEGLFANANGDKNPNYVWKTLKYFPNLTSLAGMLDNIKVNGVAKAVTFDFENIINELEAAGIVFAQITSIENFLRYAKIKSFTPIFDKFSILLKRISGAFYQTDCETENNNLASGYLINNGVVNQKALKKVLPLGDISCLKLNFTGLSNVSFGEGVKYLDKCKNYTILENEVYIVFHRQYPFVYEVIEPSDFTFLKNNISNTEIAQSDILSKTSNTSDFTPYTLSEFISYARSYSIDNLFNNKDVAYIKCQKIRFYDLNENKQFISKAPYCIHEDMAGSFANLLPVKKNPSISSTMSYVFVRSDTYFELFQNLSMSLADMKRVFAGTYNYPNFNMPKFATVQGLDINGNYIYYNNNDSVSSLIDYTSSTGNVYGMDDIKFISEMKNSNATYAPLDDLVFQESVVSSRFLVKNLLNNNNEAKIWVDNELRYLSPRTTRGSIGTTKYFDLIPHSIIVDFGNNVNYVIYIWATSFYLDYLDEYALNQGNFNVCCTLSSSLFKSYENILKLLEKNSSFMSNYISYNSSTTNFEFKKNSYNTGNSGVYYETASIAVERLGRACIPKYVEEMDNSNIVCNPQVSDVSYKEGFYVSKNYYYSGLRFFNDKSLVVVESNSNLANVNTTIGNNILRKVGIISTVGKTISDISIDNNYKCKALFVESAKNFGSIANSSLTKLCIDTGTGADSNSTVSLVLPSTLKSFNHPEIVNDIGIKTNKNLFVIDTLRSASSINIDMRSSNSISNYSIPLLLYVHSHIFNKLNVNFPYFGGLSDETKESISKFESDWMDYQDCPLDDLDIPSLGIGPYFCVGSKYKNNPTYSYIEWSAGIIRYNLTPVVDYCREEGIYLDSPPYSAEVEYLTPSSSSSYIDTGVWAGAQHLKIELGVYYSSWSSYGAFYGGSNIAETENNHRLIHQNSNNSNVYVTIGNKQGASLSLTAAANFTINKWHTLIADDDTYTITVDGKISKRSSVTYGTAPATSKTIRLFNSSSNNAARPNVVRISYFKLWQSGELILDLIPVRRQCYGGCMFNKVNKSIIFPNGGSSYSTFSCGPDKT